MCDENSPRSIKQMGKLLVAMIEHEMTNFAINGDIPNAKKMAEFANSVALAIEVYCPKDE